MSDVRDNPMYVQLSLADFGPLGAKPGGPKQADAATPPPAERPKDDDGHAANGSDRR